MPYAASRPPHCRVVWRMHGIQTDFFRYVLAYLLWLSDRREEFVHIKGAIFVKVIAVK